MRILYLSCHAAHEYMEVTMLKELGHEVFSPGPFVEPGNNGNPGLRPGLAKLYEEQCEEDWYQWGMMCVDLMKYHESKDVYPKDHLSEEFASRFDMLWVVHIPWWITNNWKLFKDKLIVWRTNGQSIEHQELQMAAIRKECPGLKIVRYSPKERVIKGYAGEDAVIRFHLDENEWSGWAGNTKQVISVGNAIHRRGDACGFAYMRDATHGFPRSLYGPETEAVSWGHGEVSFEELKEIYRTNRCYFYTGTKPACYTMNFMEAAMTGMPIVAIGPECGHMSPEHQTYEVHELLAGVTDSSSDHPLELGTMIENLLLSHQLAKEASVKIRDMAVKTFGKKVIIPQWKEFFNGL